MMRDMDACDLSDSNKAAGEEKEKEKACENSISSTGDGGGVGLGVNVQQHQQSRMMVRHDNHHRNPSPSFEIVWCDGGIGTTSNLRPQNSSIGDIYNTTGGVSGSTTPAVISVLKTLQQPFDTAIAAAAATQSILKSPGTAAAMGFPFTNAQWKELERQAMIYKYMMASTPVPSDLLFPITRNSPAPHLGNGLNLIRFSNGGDLEPRRCRRTDGKKWRCSRDVAPNQKYCERHLHRGRPRSRKPVELPAGNKKKTRLEPNSNTFINNNKNFIPSPSQFLGNFSQYPPHIQSAEKAATVQSVKELSSLDWMIKEEDVHMNTPAGPEWHHLMQQTGIDVDNSSVLNQHFLEEPLNLKSCTNFSAGEQQSNECPLFVSPDLTSLQKQTPRGFIDAWANGVSSEDQNSKSCNRGSVSSSGNLSFAPLSLSMGGNNTTDEPMCQVQMGLGIVESGQDHECTTKPSFSNWLNTVSWAASTPGGPLAEVLRPSTVAASGPLSPTAGNVYAGSPWATAVSSPSGVLQKTIASWSDSSGSSSPTLAGSRTNNPETALLWLNQGK